MRAWRGVRRALRGRARPWAAGKCSRMCILEHGARRAPTCVLTSRGGATYTWLRDASCFGGLPSFRGPRSGVGLRVSGVRDDDLFGLPRRVRTRWSVYQPAAPHGTTIVQFSALLGSSFLWMRCVASARGSSSASASFSSSISSVLANIRPTGRRRDPASIRQSTSNGMLSCARSPTGCSTRSKPSVGSCSTWGSRRLLRQPSTTRIASTRGCFSKRSSGSISSARWTATRPPIFLLALDEHAQRAALITEVSRSMYAGPETASAPHRAAVQPRKPSVSDHPGRRLDCSPRWTTRSHMGRSGCLP